MIPSRFVDRIIRHAMSVRTIPTYPLLLAVQGPPGVGKTYQTYRALRMAKFETFRESAASLRGQHEGDSVDAFVKIYERARECAIDPARPTATILIEDFDLSGAVRFVNTEYTVNQQLLVNHLMNLCDGFEEGGRESVRIPIFLTGNNFSTLHEPLRRHGRLDVFTWRPKPDEQAKIVAGMLSEVATEPQVAAELLLAKLPAATIATLRFLIDQVASNYVYAQFKDTPDLGLAIWSEASYQAYKGLPTERLVGDLLDAYESLDTAENFLGAETDKGEIE